MITSVRGRRLATAAIDSRVVPGLEILEHEMYLILGSIAKDAVAVHVWLMRLAIDDLRKASMGKECLASDNVVVEIASHRKALGEPSKAEKDLVFRVVDLSVENSHALRSECLGQSVDTLGLGVRARKVMWRQKIETIGDLTQWTPRELMATKGCGPSTLQEIRDVLSRFGVSLRGSL